MFLIFLGPPGSGKGTQAKFLESELNLVHLSTGDLLRLAVKERTQIGKQAKVYMDKGELVPDNLIVGLIKTHMDSALSKNGYLLDGFPRTLGQVEMLEEMLSETSTAIDRVIKFSLSDETVIKRLTSRLVCSVCGANFNTFFNPPKKTGFCGNCGSRLEKRGDDQAEIVRKRLEVYSQQSQPVEEYYRKQKKLVEVDASQTLQKTSAALKGLIVKNVSKSARSKSQ